MLVGFSMGGLIIRTYLSDHPEHADARVAGVVFLESALQGSYAGLLAKGANSSEALDRCAAGLDVPIAGRRICSTMLGLIRQKLELANEDAIAFRDLSPGSEIVRANAGAEPPGEPRYLNLPGDIRLKLPLTLGAATYPGAGSEIPIGDVLIPRGNPDPSAVPALGGAGFEPVDLDARTIPLTRRCGVGAKALQSLAEATLEGDPETAMPLKCFDPPEAHWNVNADAAESRPRRGTPIPTLVADFLVETCKAEHLGRCAPEPLIGSGGRCGVLETGESWRGLFQGPRRPINLEVKVLDGAPVTCSEARKILLWYTKAYNPCVDAGNTCRLERPDLPGQRGGWACSAPTAGSYPLMYRCDSSEQGTSVGGFDAVGPSAAANDNELWQSPGRRYSGSIRRESQHRLRGGYGHRGAVDRSRPRE